MEEYRVKIREIIKEIAPYNDYNDQTNLIEEGILDSLGIVYLISELQDTYNICLDEEKITPDNFNCIDGIVEFIIKNYFNS